MSISSLAHEYPSNWEVPEHSHRSDQLIYAVSGVMQLAVSKTRLLVPPQFAVWVSANTPHSIRMPYAVSMRTLYLRPKLAHARNCSVLHVTPLMRELVLEITRTGGLSNRKRIHAALRDVLIAQIDNATPIPTSLTMPDDPRARLLAQATLLDPLDKRRLESRCRDFGMSARTLQRIFLRELGINFDSWQRQLRLLKAVELLASGASVKAVAAEVGYRQASTFISMFAQQFGQTPRAWSAIHLPATIRSVNRVSDTNI
jgi:AraC-like DNA-binding protein